MPCTLASAPLRNPPAFSCVSIVLDSVALKSLSVEMQVSRHHLCALPQAREA